MSDFRSILYGAECLKSILYVTYYNLTVLFPPDVDKKVDIWTPLHINNINMRLSVVTQLEDDCLYEEQIIDRKIKRSSSKNE